MGQADGLSAVHAGRVLVRGANSRVLALWSEHTAVDLTDIPAAAAGDEVVIYGRQGEAVITMQEVLALHPDSRELNIAMDLAPSVNREYLGASIEQAQTAHQPR
jgi:alanine racemase